MADLESQIKITADATGVEAGVSKAKRSLADLGKSASEAGKQAGAGLGAVGAGGDKAAKQVEQATKSIQRDLERQIAAFQAGEKGSRAYVEALAKMRGVNVANLKPLLDQLDSVKKKTEAAVVAQASLGSAAASAGARLIALSGVTSVGALLLMVQRINMGVDALNDLSDATGSTVENISALEAIAKRTGGNFDTVSTSLIKFNQALATTVKPGGDAEKVITAIGLSAKELRNLDPAEALRQTALALEKFADDGNKARAVQELFGKSLKEVAPFLKDLAEAGSLNATVTKQQALEAEKLQKEIFKLQAGLGDLGRALAGPVVSGMNELIALFRTGSKEGETFVGSLLELLGTGNVFVPGIKAAGELINSFGGGARSLKDVVSELDGINRQLQRTTLLETQRAALIQRQTKLRKELNALYSTASAAESAAASSIGKASIALKEAGGKAAGAVNQISDAQREYADAMRDFQRISFSATASSEDLTKAQQRLLELQSSPHWAKYTAVQQASAIASADAARADELRAEAVKRAAQATKDSLADNVRYYESLQQVSDRLAEQVKQEREHLASIGLSKPALVELAAAKLDDAAATKEQRAALADIIDPTKALGDEYRNQAKALRELASLKRQGGEKELRLEIGDAIMDGAAKAREEWERTNQTIADSFVDNLMRGGKSVAQYLKDLFRTLVLRPILQPIGNALASAVSGLMGGGGGIGSVPNMGMLSGLTNNFGMGGIAGGLGAFGSAASSTAQGVFLGMGELSSLGFGEALSGGIAAVMEGSIAAGFGTIAGVLGPIGLAIGAIASILDSKRGGPKSESGFAGINGNLNIETRFGDSSAAREISNTITASYKAIAQQLGLVQQQLDVGLYYAMDPQGTAKTLLQVSTPSYDRNARLGGIENVARGEEALKAAIAEETIRAIFAGLQASDLSAKFKDYLSGVDLSASGAELQKRIDDVVQVKNIAALFDVLGKAFAAVGAQTVATTAAMIEAAGGFDKLAGNLSSYYENFYTEEEKRRNIAESISKSLAGAGVNMGADSILASTREQFRALVEQFQAVGNTGAVNALLAVNAAFASITPLAESLSESVGGVAEGLAEAVERLRQPAERTIEEQARNVVSLEAEANRLAVEWLRALGRNTEADTFQRSLDIEGWNAAEIATYDYNVALRKQIQAIEDAAIAQAKLAEQIEETKRRVDNAREGLRAYGDQLQGSVNTLSGEINTLRGQALDAVRVAAESVQTALGNLKAAADSANQALAQAIASAQASLGGVAQANVAAQSNLTAAQSALGGALQGVADQITQAANAVAAAQDQVASARKQITQGFLAAQAAEQSVRNRVASAYLAAQTEVTDAQQRLADLQQQAADSMREAGNTILSTLRQIAGASGGSGSLSTQRAAFSSLAERAMAGDPRAIAQLSQSGLSLLNASRTGSTSAAQFKADELLVRRMLGGVLGVTGFGEVSQGQDEVSLAQAELAAATDRLTAAQSLATQYGVDLAASNENLAVEMARAVLEVARWSSAVEVSGASRIAETEGALTQYNAAIANLANAQDSQARLLALTQSLDLSGTQQAADAWAGAVQAATAAQTALTVAQTAADTAAVDLAEAMSLASAAGLSLASIESPLEQFKTSLAAMRLAQTNATNATNDLTTGLAEAAALGVDLEGIRSPLENLRDVAGKLATAQSAAAQVSADLFDSGAGLVTQYLSLSERLQQATADLDAFNLATLGLDLEPVQVSLASLVAEFNNATQRLVDLGGGTPVLETSVPTTTPTAPIPTAEEIALRDEVREMKDALVANLESIAVDERKSRRVLEAVSGPLGNGFRIYVDV